MNSKCLLYTSFCLIIGYKNKFSPPPPYGSVEKNAYCDQSW